MVDTLSVPLDGFMACGDAVTEEYVSKKIGNSLFCGRCTSRLPVRNALRTGTGYHVPPEFQGYGRLDSSGSPLRCHTRCQQFLLRTTHSSTDRATQTCGQNGKKDVKILLVSETRYKELLYIIPEVVVRQDLNFYQT